MKVRFAQISYKEVSETRKKVLSDYTHARASWGYIKESGFHYLKRFPFLVIWVKFFDIYLKHCNAIVVNSTCTFLGIENLAGKVSLTIISLALMIIFSHVIIFSIARRMFPQKTPIGDRVSCLRKFYDKTEYLEEVTRVMDKLQKLSAKDLANTELIINENSVVMMIKNSEWGYIEKNKYAVKNENVLKTLRETGVLDFSSVDDDWNIFTLKLDK